MGEGDKHKANGYFSLFVYTTVLCGIIISSAAYIFIRPIAEWLGAYGTMLDDCVIYGRILIISLPFQMLQFEFQSFFITAEKPHLGLVTSVVAGITNMALDALFIIGFNWGIEGAAWATALSQFAGGIFPMIYFGRKNDSLLKLTKPAFDGNALLKATANGSSELMTNISMSLVGMLYNTQLIAYAEENGVAAYGVLMYVNLIFLSIYIGYATGTAPVISYHYGAQNTTELKSLRKKSNVLIFIFSIAMFLLAELLAKPLSLIFVSYDKALLDITLRGFFIYSFSFLFAGFAIFGSSFFTALNDGFTSALISFLRTLVFQAAAVILFPLIWGIDGIWLSIVAAEAMAAFVSFIFIALKKQKYRY